MKQKKSWLNGKTAVVTGATGGLGKELVKQLLEKYGVKVIGIGRTPEKVEALLKELSNPNFTTACFDVSKNANWEDFCRNLAQKSLKIDILINNAGIMPAFKRFEEHTLEEAQNVINTNLFSSIYSCKNLLPILKESSSPAIINISSACAYSAVIGTSMYSASKSALKGFTDSLREENKNNIYIAGVYPGFIKTDLFRNGKLTSTIEKFASTPEKIASKILSKMHHRRKHITVGADGKALAFFSRILPNSTSPIMTSVLTSSNQENFRRLKDEPKRK